MPHKTKSLLLALAAARALVPRANPKNGRLQRTRLHEKPIDSDEMASLYQELRARQSDVEADRAQTLERWRTGGCSSTVAVAASDWVRRMAFDGGTVAFGTASGGVGCCRVGQGPSRADVVKAHPRAVEGQDLSKLHGAYDGGGVTAIDMAGRVVVSGGRGGQVQVHRAVSNGDSLTLEAVTTLDVSVGSTVSSVAVADDGKTLVACALDGSIQGFSCENDEWQATWSSKNDAAALTVILDEERDACVVGFSDGEVYALDDLENPLVTVFGSSLDYPSGTCGVFIASAGEGTTDATFDNYRSSPETDVDKDGMTDQWEVDNFGDLFWSDFEDFDEDGQTNLEEFLGGSNPADPTSLAGSAEIGPLDVRVNEGELTVSFAQQAGYSYELELSSDLRTWSIAEEAVLAGAGTFILPLAGQDELYLRVLASRQ